MAAEGDDALPNGALADATLRQVVRASAGGGQVRVRFSNAFGRAPLVIAHATLARSADRASARVRPETMRTLRFAGSAAVTIPPGADWVSDPVAWPIAAFDDLAVSAHIAASDGRTSHLGSRATSYVVAGDRTADADLADPRRVAHWYHLAGLEVRRCAPRPPCRGRSSCWAISITDGYGVALDSNTRWTDALARRLGGRVAVVNQGIGGNRILGDGLGPSVLSRLDRDVLAQPGIGHLIVLAGVNDLGGLARTRTATPQQRADLTAQIIAAYAQIVARARAHGIRVHGATILPFMASGYYKPDAAIEASRQAINAWLRTPGNVDGVIDIDRGAARSGTARLSRREVRQRRPASLDRRLSRDGRRRRPDGVRPSEEAATLIVMAGPA
ncbi:MAG: GDSL-type esterase/lipase family protein [Sphingomonas taxi]